MPDFLQRFVLIELTGRRPLVLAFGLLTGAAWYTSLWFEPDARWLFGILALALIAVWFVLRRVPVAPPVALLLIFGLGTLIGAAAGKAATLRADPVSITAPIGPVMVEGWVSEVEPATRGVRLRLQVHAIDDLARGQIPKTVRLTHTTRLEVEAGRFVRCWAVLRPPPGPIVKGDYAFDRQAFYEGLGAVGYVQGRCRGGTLGAPQSLRQRIELYVAKQRRQLAHFVKARSGERAGGFAAALASGDRSFMASADQEALRGSGLAHLLAISGLHMGIVGGLIYLMVWRGLAMVEPVALRLPVQKPAAAAALVASLVYLILSGASVSTQRAFVMAAIFFGGILLDRAPLSLRSFSIAMIVVILIAPWSVLSPGFQMSFAATGALIATYEAWQRKRRAQIGPRDLKAAFWIKSLIVTSVVTSAATAPFALYHFDRVAGFGLLANLLAMPIVSLISAPVAGAALVLSPLGLVELPLRIFGYSLEAVLAIAHWVSGLSPLGTEAHTPMPVFALGLFSLSLLLGAIGRNWPQRLAYGTAAALAGAGIWWTSAAPSVHWGPSGDVYIASPGGAVDRIAFHKGDGLAPLRYADAPITSYCQTRICTRVLGDLTLVLVADQPLVADPPAPADSTTQSGASPVSCRSLDHAHLVLWAARDPAPSCDIPIVTWSDIEQQNGLSWRVDDGALAPFTKPPCDARPWQICPSYPG
ncbi:MAG: ComEC/Rec2 family competence protein [Henriciella sp.]|nr:ComEC/Rec2 family competence protein [Henriciella sp.]